MTMRRCTCGYFTCLTDGVPRLSPQAHVPPTEVPERRRSMKFGKHLKTVAVEGWEYLDYKQLKQLLKRLQSMGVGSKEAGEKQFM